MGKIGKLSPVVDEPVAYRKIASKQVFLKLHLSPWINF